MRNYYLCLHCLRGTRTTPGQLCAACGRKKEGLDVKAQLKIANKNIAKSRAKFSREKWEKFTDLYDVFFEPSEKYAKTIRTADEIPDERGLCT